MEKEKLVCPICGEPTYLVYGKNPRKDGLCYKHSQMLFKGEIVQCPDCGKWNEKDVVCDCKKIKEEAEKTIEETKNNVIVIENKFKSGINGIKYDIYGEEVGSQLLDYYKYIFGFKKKKSGNKLEWIKDEGLINKFKNKEKDAF